MQRLDAGVSFFFKKNICTAQAAVHVHVQFLEIRLESIII